MKTFTLIFTLFFCTIFAQRNLALDSLSFRDAKDFFADDYGNIYLYKNKDLSFTKYDSLGNQKGKIMLALPFKIQSVQNPLTISSFSENAQELRFFDQNLNDIQTIDFREKFGFIKMAYAEDLQQIWLLDDSTKRLLQYNFRDDRTINSYPFFIDFETIVDFIVFENKCYVLTKTDLNVYNFTSEKIWSIPFNNGKRLRRENQDLFIIGENTIQKLEKESLKVMFRAENSQIVDKNSRANFAIKDNKLYLYPIKKDKR